MSSAPVDAGGRPWSARMADSMIARHGPEQIHWHYDYGLLLTAIQLVGRATGDPRYWEHVRGIVEQLVAPDGTIRGYRLEEYNLDQVNAGRALFPLLRATGEDRYRRALAMLRQQLATHPRTESGGFWHKQIYPYQIWLDGVYMAGPFLAEYAQRFDEPAAFDDVAHEIILTEEKTRDPQTGLLYHAWDERKAQPWANPATGCSPHFWGRAIGWYAMALVDVLDYFPLDHPSRPELLAILARVVEAVAKVQDPATGLWWQILDHPGRPGNYLEASASAMFSYGIAKGVRRGYLPPERLPAAQAAYQGLLRELVSVDEQGLVTLNGICAVAGLGGNPYRDGSYEYYVGEPIKPNDYKGVGPFILAALELERT
jgi:unsaturated rhamnogalacturonyl hydrolase